jgi:outer membrane protein assembly factor BamD
MRRTVQSAIRLSYLSLVLALVSCGGSKTIVEENAKDQFEVSIAAYNARDYLLSEQGFKRIIFSFPSSVYVDDAQFYLAKSYVGMKDYDAAAVEFKFLIDNFPGSEFREAAFLGIAEAYFLKSPRTTLDQSVTRKAIYHLRRYLAQYPDSPSSQRAREMLEQAKDKLAKKLFESAETYRRLGAFTSERLYLETLVTQYPESSVIWEAKLRLSEILIDMGEAETAQVYLEEILQNEVLSSSLKQKARDLLVRSPQS